MIEYPVDVALVVQIETDVEHFEVISLRGVGKPRLRHAGWRRRRRKRRIRRMRKKRRKMRISSSLSMAAVVVVAPKDGEATAMMTQNLLGPSVKELFEDDERRGPILYRKIGPAHEIVRMKASVG